MKVLEEYNTFVYLDDNEQFDVRDTDHRGREVTVRVTELRRMVYPAHGGGHGAVTHGSGLARRQSDGKVGKVRKTVHFNNNRPELKAQIPAVLMEKLDELGLFAPVPDGA